jgi:hypothetical protein
VYPARVGLLSAAELRADAVCTLPPLPLHCGCAHRTWDNKLQRRRFGEYEENYSHDGDSGGIHASGAGFDRVDKIEAWSPPMY